jgi:gamma-glutamyltranspeptidase/glutathione hydrolase
MRAANACSRSRDKDPAPAAATIERVRSEGFELLPLDGLVSACVPGALDAWCRLLEEFGTRRLGDVIAPARALAERGFPMYPFLRELVELVAPRFEQSWPTSAAIYLPLRANGERQTNPRSRTGWRACATRSARRAGRARRGSAPRATRSTAAPEPRRSTASRGSPCATSRARSTQACSHAADLASYAGAVEEPLSVDYRGARVYKTGPWSQAPVFLQQLRLLDGFDLARSTRAAPTRCTSGSRPRKLAFADRDACYGDPRFADVPIETLLSREYARQRRALVDARRRRSSCGPGSAAARGLAARRRRRGTARRARRDRRARGVGATRRSVSRSTPTATRVGDAERRLDHDLAVVPELGFPLGTRLQMASLDPRIRTRSRRASARARRFAVARAARRRQLARVRHARRRPAGPVDVAVLPASRRTGRARPAGAIDAPTVHSEHMPSSFFPRHARPGVVAAESRIDAAVLAGSRRAAIASSAAARGITARARGALRSERAAEAAASPRSRSPTRSHCPDYGSSSG